MNEWNGIKLIQLKWNELNVCMYVCMHVCMCELMNEWINA